MRERYIRRKKQMQIQICDTKVENTWTTDRRENVFRYYRDGKMNFAYVAGDCDEEKIYKELAASIDQARDYLAVPQRNRQENLITDYVKTDFGTIALVVDEVMQKLTSRFSRLRLQGTITVDRQEIQMSNDNNVHLNFEDQLLGGEFELFDADTPQEKISFRLLYRRFSEEGLFAALEEYMSAYEKKESLHPDRKYKVIFSTANPTPMRKLEKDLQPDMLASGMSELSGNEDHRYFNEQMTLYVSSDPKSSRVRSDEILPFFDLEGSINPAHKKALVEEGILRGGYTCKQTAEKYGMEHTASASGKLDAYPYADAIGFCLKPSEKNLKELLHGDLGIYVCDVDRSAFDERGRFELEVKSAFLHDGNKILARLSPLKISSAGSVMFREGYIGVSADHLTGSDIDRALVLEMKASE